MIRKTNNFRSILMRKMSFLFRHLIHSELYASLLVGRGEKCYESYCKAASTKAYQGGRGLGTN
jgi:cell division protein FtsB